MLLQSYNKAHLSWISQLLAPFREECVQASHLLLGIHHLSSLLRAILTFAIRRTSKKKLFLALERLLELESRTNSKEDKSMKKHSMN